MNTPFSGEGPLILAHRGGGGEAVENSWAALEHMRANGLTVMETDVRVTADGVPVLHHDATLERMAGRAEAISALTGEQLAKIHDHSGNPPVPLDEALLSFPEIRFNIDAKEAAAVGPLAERAARHRDRIVVSSFSSSRLAQMNRATPGLFRSMGMGNVAAFLALATISPRLAHSVYPERPGTIALQIPEKYGPIPVTTPRLIEAAHRRGYEIHVWTVDDPAAADRLIAAGVDGIVTDTPVALAAHLAAQGPIRK